MTFQQKNLQLKQLITEKLTPLITGDIIQLDLPYHVNIGDILIWEGEKTFLQTLPYRCLHASSLQTFNPRYKIVESANILIHGGGNFGDLWRCNPVFWHSIVQRYPHNKIIVLPQSIFYQDEKLLAKDAEIFQRHKKITFCLRDKQSLDFANHYFPSVENILVPDMAYYLDMTKWEKHVRKQTDKTLFMYRKDHEIKNHNYGRVPIPSETRDWPTMERVPYFIKFSLYSQAVLNIFDRLFSARLKDSFTDVYYQHILRKRFIQTGVAFLSSYSHIYTTRLHGGILSMLLQKPFTWFDNSYGKISSFYDTWLSDVEDITLVR